MLLTSLLLGVVAVPPTAPPVTFPALRREYDAGRTGIWAPGRWFLRAKVGERELVLLLDPTHTTSAVRDEVLGNAREILVGGVGVPARPATLNLGDEEKEGREVDGLLGSDFLLANRMGLDPDAGTVTLWRGEPAPGELERWVGAGAASRKLSVTDGGLVSVEMRRGAAAFPVGLTSPGRTVVLAPYAFLGETVPLGKAAGTPLEAVGSGATIGGTATPLLVLQRYDLRLPDGLRGTIPFSAGLHGRIVVDGPGRRILGRPQTEDERIAEFLGVLLRLPLRVAGLKARLAGYANLKEFKPYVGREFAGIDQILVDDVIETLRDTRREEALKFLGEVRARGFRYAFRIQDGTERLAGGFINPQG